MGAGSRVPPRRQEEAASHPLHAEVPRRHLREAMLQAQAGVSILTVEKQTDRQTNRRIDGQTDGQTDKQTDRRTDRRTDRQKDSNKNNKEEEIAKSNCIKIFLL